MTDLLDELRGADPVDRGVSKFRRRWRRGSPRGAAGGITGRA